MTVLRSSLAARVFGAIVLLVVAVALIPSLVDERRLANAQERLGSDPAGALREAAESVGPATRERAIAVSVAAFVRAGDLARAEDLAADEVRRHPQDTYAVRRLYEVQRLRFRTDAAARTLETLRRIDPKYAAGTGL